MKTKLTTLLLLLAITASAQYGNLDDNKKVFTIKSDTLFVHKKDQYKIVEQSNEKRVLYWKGKRYNYTYAYYDKGYVWCSRDKKKGIELW